MTDPDTRAEDTRDAAAPAGGLATATNPSSQHAAPETGPARPRRARRGAGPFLLGGLIVLLAAALVLLLFVFKPKQGTASLAGDQQRAVDSAKQVALDLLSYRRASFDADFQRVLNATTGSLHDDIANLRQKTLDSLNNGKFDLTGDVLAAGYESSSPQGTLVLVSVDGYQVDDGGQQKLVSHQRFELTMVQAKGAWVASNLIYVGVL